MAKGRTQEEHKNELIEVLREKRILLIAPGKSSVEESDKIVRFIDSNTIVISVNHAYEKLSPHFIFISNSRRFRDLPKDKRTICIVTSNITADGIYYQEKYESLTNSEESVFDNAGLMAIKFLMKYNVEGIYLAGFDGYSHDDSENYGSSDLAFVTRNAILDAMNAGMTKMLEIYKRSVKFEFVTTPKYVKIHGEEL